MSHDGGVSRKPLARAATAVGWHVYPHRSAGTPTPAPTPARPTTPARASSVCRSNAVRVRLRVRVLQSLLARGPAELHAAMNDVSRPDLFARAPLHAAACAACGAAGCAHRPASRSTSQAPLRPPCTLAATGPRSPSPSPPNAHSRRPRAMPGGGGVPTQLVHRRPLHPTYDYARGRGCPRHKGD